MRSITKGVEDRCDIEIHAFAVMPYIRHRHGDIFRKCTCAVDADTFAICAQMATPGEAVSTATADHMAFGAHDFAGEEVGHVGTTSTISPTNSWPTTMGTGMVACAQSSHLKM